MRILDNINSLWGNDLKRTLKPGANLKIAASCFSIYAFEALKKELEKIDSLEFIFTAPAFVPNEVTDKVSKERREFYIPNLQRERNLYGSEFEIHLKNKLTQRAIAKECAEWIRRKARFRSNSTKAPMQQFACLNKGDDAASYMPLHSFTAVDLGYQQGDAVSNFITKFDEAPSTQTWLNLFNQIWKDKDARYQKLMNSVIRDGVKTKVLILSATSVNDRFNDLRNQLALAYEGDSEATINLPVRIHHRQPNDLRDYPDRTDKCGGSMKILHTSDWHLGRSLYGRKRYEEFSAFLDWLAQTIEDEKIDALLVAGDVFDTSTPSNRAQALYYRFLCRVSTSCCRHVVVIAGNHDSPSFLNAPKELLRALNVYVIGSMTDVLDDEVIVLHKDEQPEAIVCAVPYLRDKDIRTVEPGETIDDKNAKLVEGLKKHYADVCGIAEQKQTECKKAGHDGIPIVAMGHLFTAGGRTVDGDGVRELYVGSLAHVGEEVFPSSIDYLALGHLHVPQVVGSAEHMRYCGSPIPMGYGEATQKKKVVLIEFNSTKPNIQELPVPCFQQLVRIVGSLDDICAKLEELKKEESAAWLEIEYTGSDIIGNLRVMLDESLADSAMEIRRIKNRRLMDRVIRSVAENETLDDLDAGDVFTRCLDAFEVPDEDREELTASYNEIIKSLHEEDLNAE